MRFVPTRAGVLNVWEYDDQTFDFGDGRLVLRGRNGSGKSNALALLFPFLLDGVMSAPRMDPMGGSRSMKSLLLGRDDDDRTGGYRNDSGTGYVWMEFSDGATHVTIGVGASATVHRDADAWFFVVDGRVGVDFELVEDDIPLTRRKLEERLGPGVVRRRAEEYRDAVDRRLFGLGAARYRSLVDLLLTLRRPHLAGKLDTEHLSATLSAGLGEVDAALIEDVAHSFDDLDAMRHELDGLTASLDAVERFLPIYRQHLVAHARDRATTLDATRAEVRRITADQRRVGEARAATVEEHDRVSAALVTADEAVRGLDDTITTIQVSPAYRSAVALAEVEQAAATAAEASLRAAARQTASEHDVEVALDTHRSAQSHVDRCVERVDEAVADWRGAGRAAGIDWQPPAASGRVEHGVPSGDHEPAGDQAPTIAPAGFDEAHATTLVIERHAALDEVVALARTRAEAADAARRADAELTERSDLLAAATDEATDSRRALHAARLALMAERDRWWTRVGDAVGSLTELVPGLALPESVFPTVPDINTHVDQFADEADPDDPMHHVIGDASPTRHRVDDAAVDRAAFHETDRLLAALAAEGQRARDAAERDVAEQTTIIGDLQGEYRRVAEEPNPGPPPNPTRPDAHQTGRGGLPLYVCVDFADTVAESARAGIEAALGASGLLDARIGGPAPDPNLLDATILWSTDATNAARATAGVPAGTLADLLVPVPVDGLDAASIASALAAVPLDDGVVALHDDGRWRLGPLTGRFHQDEPLFIGHTARERRRAARLAELQANLDEARTEQTRRAAHLAEIVAGCAELEKVRTTQPSIDGVQTAADTRRAAIVRWRERSAAHERSRALADEATQHAEAASSALHRRATALRLPADPVELDGVRGALRSCDRAIARITSCIETLDAARSALGTATETLERDRSRATADRGVAAEAQARADREAARYAALQATVGGDAQGAVERLAEARRERERQTTQLESLRAVQIDARTRLATLDERLDGLARAHAGAVEAADEASARFAVITSDEIAEVLAVEGVEPRAEPARAAKAVLASTEPPPDDATNRMEKAHREILLDGLRAGHDPSMPKVDGIDVVRVGTTDGELPIGALARSLRENHDRTALLLSDRERAIFETHLLTNVGEALRHLLLEADAFEQRINTEMTKAPTESGMVVELTWEVADDDPEIRGAIKALRTDANLLGPEQREALRAFFMRRITDERSRDPGRSFAETLGVVLDYRSWHRFALFARFADGKRQRVTRKFFKGLSGGEAATLLHLPLFAAAASQYSSGNVAGPRLIALDEAFAGIDDQMRARLMGLLTDLDLDVILTSHEFWGFYGSVPSLVLYDLVRRPPNPGVFAQRFDWTAGEVAGR